MKSSNRVCRPKKQLCNRSELKPSLKEAHFETVKYNTKVKLKCETLDAYLYMN